MADITSATTAESTDSKQSDDGSDDDLPGVFEEIGADLDRVERAREVYDEESFEGIVALAERIAGDDGDEVVEMAEDYRHSNGINRCRSNWGYDRGVPDGFIGEWFRQFFGPSDGSEEGTHNQIQKRARDNDVNLPWYKVMFPEPHPDYDEDSVQLTERDDLVLPVEAMREDESRWDSNIFVPRWYAERFAEYANDDGIPLPPFEAPDGEYGGSDDEIDPADYTVDELKDVVADIDDHETLVLLNEREREGKDRKTAREAIERRITATADVDDGSDDEASALDLLIEEKGLEGEEAELARKLLA